MEAEKLLMGEIWSQFGLKPWLCQFLAVLLRLIT